jgi:hypothetical protein
MEGENRGLKHFLVSRFNIKVELSFRYKLRFPHFSGIVLGDVFTLTMRGQEVQNVVMGSEEVMLDILVSSVIKFAVGEFIDESNVNNPNFTQILNLQLAALVG